MSEWFYERAARRLNPTVEWQKIASDIIREEWELQFPELPDQQLYKIRAGLFELAGKVTKLMKVEDVGE